MNIENPFVPFEDLNQKNIIKCLQNLKKGEFLEFSNSWNLLSDLDKLYAINIATDLFDPKDKVSFENYKWIKENVSDFKNYLEICYVFNFYLADIPLSENSWTKDTELKISEKIGNPIDKKYKLLFYRNIEKLHESINDLK